MRIDLRKFFEAYEGSPHQLAAIDVLSEAMQMSYWINLQNGLSALK